MLAAILESGDLRRLYRGLSLLVVTASEGEPARGLVGFEALGPLLAGDLEERARAVGGEPFARSMVELRAAAEELPDCRVWACAAAVEEAGLSLSEVEARLDGVLSTPRFLREVADARLVVV